MSSVCVPECIACACAHGVPKSVLELLEAVRRALAPHFPPLQTDLKVHTRRVLGSYHGRAETKSSGFSAVAEDVLVARSVVPVAVTVATETDQGTPLPLALVVFTFLHELGHCITPAEKRRGKALEAVPAAVLRLQSAPPSGSDDWVQIHHTPAFYQGFADLLRVAERLGIFRLPAQMRDKFSQRSLMRLDAIDVNASLQGLNLGEVPFAQALPFSSSACALDGSHLCVNLVLAKGGGRSEKAVVLESRTLASLEDAAKRKFRTKGVHAFALLQGGEGPLTDEALAVLRSGARVEVRVEKKGKGKGAE